MLQRAESHSVEPLKTPSPYQPHYVLAFSPITSTYPLPFLGFFGWPFRSIGGPNRSSILLALLWLVVGLLGGPLAALPLETVRVMGDPNGLRLPDPGDCASGLVEYADTARCGGALPLIGFGADMVSITGGPLIVRDGGAIVVELG